MKKFTAFFMILISLLLMQKNTYSQGFNWAKRAGSWAFDSGKGICSDQDGNIYVTGKFEMDSDFDHIKLETYGNHDVFIAKYSPEGEILWVKAAGGDWGDKGHAIACDQKGGLYITGEFEVTSYFGNDSVKTWGRNDVFLAKYTTEGDFLWVDRVCGGRESNKGYGVSVFGDEVYVTGKMEDTVHFDNGITLQVTGDPEEDKDLFLAKYDASGEFQWVKQIGSKEEDDGLAVANDQYGNVYVTGYFYDTTYVDGNMLISNGGRDALIAKFDASGNYEWGIAIGGEYNDEGNGIVIDKSDRIFLTGYFRVKAYFGSTKLRAEGKKDVYVACYDLDGNTLWAKGAGGELYDAALAIAIDDMSNIYITGHFGDTAYFENNMLIADDSSDVFVASYDYMGNYRWALAAGGAADETSNDDDPESGTAICVNSNDDVFITGRYRNDISFGGSYLDGWQHTDIFVAKVIPYFGAFISLDGAPVLCPGETVDLTANTGPGYSYQWYRNNTTIPGAIQATLTVSLSGDYKVKITKDSSMAVSSVVTISEEKVPEADFTFNELTSPHFTLSFWDSSLYAKDWIWDFGDGTIDNVQDPVHTFPEAGSYTVCLTAENSCGSSFVCEQVEVNCPKITPDFTYTANDLTVSFKDISKNHKERIWGLGDGTTDTTANPVHSYLDPGTYQVQLRAINANCDAIVAKDIEVKDGSTGMVQFGGNENWKVYPNPTENRIFITAGSLTGNKVAIQLTSLTGQLVYKKEFAVSGGRFSQNITGLDFTPGVYLLHISTEEETLTGKIVFE